MLLQIGEVGLVSIPKCGTRGVKYAAQAAGFSFDEIGPEKFRRLRRRIVNLREPRLRLQSAFKMYSQKGRLIEQLWPTGSFEEFVLAVCRRPARDRHTKLQADYVEGLDLTHILKWDFHALAFLLGTGPVPHVGRFYGEPVWTTPALVVFERAYARDLELWNG